MAADDASAIVMGIERQRQEEMAHMVHAVREVCPSASKQDVAKLLISKDMDVQATINAILTGQTNELDEWSTSQTKNKKKKKKKGKGGEGGGAAAAAPAAAPAAAAAAAPAPAAAPQPKKSILKPTVTAPAAPAAADGQGEAKAKPAKAKPAKPDLREKEAQALAQAGFNVAESGMRKFDVKSLMAGGPATAPLPAKVPAAVPMAMPQMTAPKHAPAAPAAPTSGMPQISAIGTKSSSGMPTFSVDSLPNFALGTAIVTPPNPSTSQFNFGGAGGPPQLQEAQQNLNALTKNMEQKWQESYSACMQSFAALKSLVQQRESEAMHAIQQAQLNEMQLLNQRQQFLNQSAAAAAASNYTDPEPLKKIAAFNDATKRDLPAWSASRFVGGEIKPFADQLAKFGIVRDQTKNAAPAMRPASGAGVIGAGRSPPVKAKHAGGAPAAAAAAGGSAASAQAGQAQPQRAPKKRNRKPKAST